MFSFKHEVDYGDMLCMIAVGMDLDERQTYQSYVFAGGKPKDFKWSSPDRAGTVPQRSQQQDLINIMNSPGSVQQMAHAGGRVNAFNVAKAQGREIVFIDEKGLAWTPEGKQTKRTLDHFVLPISYRENING